MAECNTVSQGGKIGVSNVFASALWALDYMWSVALSNGVGVNFHGGSISKYAPIVVDEKEFLSSSYLLCNACFLNMEVKVVILFLL